MEAFILSAPEGSRTPNLQIRSLPLYPIELRARWESIFNKFLILLQGKNAGNSKPFSNNCYLSSSKPFNQALR